MTKEQQILIRLLRLEDTDKSWLAIFSEITELYESTKRPAKEVLASDGSVLDQETFDGIMRVMRGAIDEANEEIGRQEVELDDATEMAERANAEIADLKAKLVANKTSLASDGSFLDQDSLRVLSVGLGDSVRLANSRLAEIESLKAELAKHTWRPVSEYDKHVGVGVLALLRVQDDGWHRAVVGWRDSSSNWHYHDARTTQEPPTHFAHLPMEPK